MDDENGVQYHPRLRKPPHGRNPLGIRSPPIKLGGVKKCKLQKNRVEGVKKIMLHFCNFLRKCNLHFLRGNVQN